MIVFFTVMLVLIGVTIMANIYSEITSRSVIRMSYKGGHWIIEKRLFRQWITATRKGDTISFQQEKHAHLFMRMHWREKQRRRGKLEKKIVKNLDI